MGNEQPRDTVTLDVIYIGLVRFPGNSNTLSYLENRKLLKSESVKSSLLFKVADCPFEYNVLYSNEHEKSKWPVIAENTRVQITCVIFRDRDIPLYSNESFPVVTKIKVLY